MYFCPLPSPFSVGFGVEFRLDGGGGGGGGGGGVERIQRRARQAARRTIWETWLGSTDCGEG